MHSRTVINSLATASVAALLMFVAQVSSAADLVGALTSQLGVSSAQAAGGAGSIFGLAKQNLSVAEFGEIADTYNPDRGEVYRPSFGLVDPRKRVDDELRDGVAGPGSPEDDGCSVGDEPGCCLRFDESHVVARVTA